ncbi:DUF3429 domain-containing protein [Thalassotalea euphylliae]|uniref:DUF3429 domain-containing protein n=2 Tax=Thalassotalea euphylliae TaxID=1655234 RepID=A0A3E0U1B0_9GAMM|nr:DUF3429 domain-containing protein [Thalassotalea euphylliae]
MKTKGVKAMANIINWRTLGYLGLIPFIAAAWAATTNTSLLSLSPYQVFVAYSACILSFLAGTLWLKQTAQIATIISNLFTLVAFACLLLPAQLALPVLASGFVLLLASEFKMGLFTDKPLGYQLLRIVLTSIVVLCHILIFSAL